MAIHDQHFYFGSIRKATYLVGTIFDNIKISRDGQVFAVPVRYGKKDVWYKKIVENFKTREDSDIVTNQTFPIISYELASIDFDATRSMHKMNYVRGESIDSNGNKIHYKQFQPVPYNVSYNVTIITKYTEDGLQIIEQVLPYFNPVVNFRVVDNRDTNRYYDVAINIVGGVTPEDNYQSGFDENRLITWPIQLVAKINLHHPLIEQKQILTSTADLINMEPEYNLETITAVVNDPSDGDKENSTVAIT